MSQQFKCNVFPGWLNKDLSFTFYIFEDQQIKKGKTVEDSLSIGYLIQYAI